MSEPGAPDDGEPTRPMNTSSLGQLASDPPFSETLDGPPSQFKRGDLLSGQPKWILEARLGGGGFGEVWRAEHTLLLKMAAVKFCTHADTRLATHEMKVVLRVLKQGGNHPNIVALLDCNLEADIPWLMYEYIEGRTLDAAVTEWAGLSGDDRLNAVLTTLHTLSAAVAHCHTLAPPIVHRDLKPTNVMLDKTGKLYVLDFGIGAAAWHLGGTKPTNPVPGATARLPTHLQRAHTPGYASIEQRHGSPPDPRDDVYSLAVIAYQLLLGDLRRWPDPTRIRNDLVHLQLPGSLVQLIATSVDSTSPLRPKDATEWERQLSELLPTRRISAGQVPSSISTSDLPFAKESGAPTGAANLCVQADADYEQAEAYDFGQRGFPLDRGRAQECYDRARKGYQKAAALGDANAQYRLGRTYDTATGVKEDRTLAWEWYKKAAEQGQPDAQYALGVMYYLGRGVRQNYEEARAWWEKIAESSPAAQFNLGVLYHTGAGAVLNDNEARNRWEIAAEKGHTKAQYNLGVLYHSGRGVARNYAKACEWYARAADQGHDRAKKVRALLGRAKLIGLSLSLQAWLLFCAIGFAGPLSLSVCQWLGYPKLGVAVGGGAMALVAVLWGCHFCEYLRKYASSAALTAEAPIVGGFLVGVVTAVAVGFFTHPLNAVSGVGLGTLLLLGGVLVSIRDMRRVGLILVACTLLVAAVWIVDGFGSMSWPSVAGGAVFALCLWLAGCFRIRAPQMEGV